MPSNTSSEFPPLPEVVIQGWVKKMTASEREMYDTRTQEIQNENVANFIDRVSSIPGFEDVPRESIEHLAMRFAIVVNNINDLGIQQGMDAVRTTQQYQQNSDANFRMATISAGYAGMG